MALRSTVAYHAESLTLNRALDLQVDVYSDLEYNHDMEWNRYLNPDLVQEANELPSIVLPCRH